LQAIHHHESPATRGRAKEVLDVKLEGLLQKSRARAREADGGEAL
jgi:hypothetical protein